MSSAELERRISELEAQVAELRDLEAIRALRRRYHECINEGLHGEVIGLFSEDASVDFGYLGSARGRGQLEHMFNVELFTDEVGFIKQFVHSHAVELDGDCATGFSYLEARTVTGGESFMVCARYDDDYVRERDGWKFARMDLTLHFAVPLSEGWAQADRLKLGR